MGCAAAALLAGCSNPADDQYEIPSPAATSTATSGPALSERTIQAAADALRQQVPCADSDTLLDDLSFWDQMRGYDCFDGSANTFIRVYAHEPSVEQTLAEWDGTFGADRTFVYGSNWYVIGPPAVVRKIAAPTAMPREPGRLRPPEELTAEQDYLSTCARFGASEGERYVAHPAQHSSSAEQYEALFPGVTDVLHAAIDDLGRESIKHIPDRDRWIAALSAAGPELKSACADAYDEVGDTVGSVGGGTE